MSKSKTHFEAFGYQPMRMKPVHFATGYFLSLTQEHYRLETLNKVATISSKKGLIGEYEATALFETLTTSTTPRLAKPINVSGLNLLRKQVNAIVANDDAVYPAYGEYKAFGCDYTLSSGFLITNHDRLDGYSGFFINKIFSNSQEGLEILEFSKSWISNSNDTIHNFLRPLLDTQNEVIPWDNTYSSLFGDLEIERINAISEDMILATKALAQLCRTLESRESHHARLRSLIIGLGVWIILYQVRESAKSCNVSPNALFFNDFTKDSTCRSRATSRMCFSKHREMIFRSYENWLNTGRIANLNDFTKSNQLDLKFLEQNFSSLAVRSGIAQPRAMQTKAKHYELQPDTVRAIITSILEPDTLIPLNELAIRLRNTWQICFGGCHDDREKLRENGYYGLDEDDDLRRNRNSFVDLLKTLGLAYEPSDGLVLCGLESEMFL
jgi:hypothetical protein